MNHQRRALWWLANKIRAYSGSGQFDDKGWFAYCGGEPPTTENCRRKIIYGNVLIDGYLADMQPNPLVAAALMSAGYPLGSENHQKLYEALLVAGVTRTAAAWLKPPKMLSPTFPVMEQLDALVNRLADPPSEDDGRTVLDCLVEALHEHIRIHRPDRPAPIHFKRWRAFQICRSHQGVVEQELARTKKTITYQAVQHSVALVDDYYLSINPADHIASKPRNRTSTVIVEPQIMAENILSREPVPGE